MNREDQTVAGAGPDDRAGGAERSEGADRPRLLGITGGIGTGKSVLARFLSMEFGPPLVDADALGHEALLPGTSTHDAVLARFGEDLLELDGTVSRPRLARIVFSDPAALRDLESIVHPWILERIETRRCSLKASGYTGIILLDAALLLDWRKELAPDGIVVVTAPEEARVGRLEQRGLSEAESRERMASQRSEEEWTPAADWIVVNDGDRDDLARKARALWADVCSRWRLPIMQGNLGRGAPDDVRTRKDDR